MDVKDWGKKRIVFADDDQDDRFIYEMAFADLKASDRFQLEFAVDGVDLLTKIKSGKTLPAMVFLDLNMPGLNGKECLAALRELAPPVELPVVILSTSQSERDVAETYDLKANLYLQKPTSYESITATLKRCIEKAGSTWQETPRERFFVAAA